MEDVVLRVSALVDLIPQLGEADLNPVRVLPDGTVLVLDARIRVDSKAIMDQQR